MLENIKKITNIDGHTISLHIFSPSKSEYSESNYDGVILAVHGLGEHSDRYRSLAEFTCNKNKVFAIFDLRGHGIESLKKADVQNFHCLVLDIIFSFHVLRKLFPNVKPSAFALFGHSLGGLLVTNSAAILLDNVKQIFLSAPFYAAKQKIPGWKILLANNTAHLLPELAIPLGVDPNHISHNKENIKSYKKDPKVITHVSARFGKMLLEALNPNFIKTAIQNITANVTILLPKDDQLVDTDFTRQIMNSFQSKVYVCEVENSGHEAFNEDENVRKIAFAHYEKWLENI